MLAGEVGEGGEGGKGGTNVALFKVAGGRI